MKSNKKPILTLLFVMFAFVLFCCVIHDRTDFYDTSGAAMVLGYSNKDTEQVIFFKIYDNKKLKVYVTDAKLKSDNEVIKENINLNDCNFSDFFSNKFSVKITDIQTRDLSEEEYEHYCHMEELDFRMPQYIVAEEYPYKDDRVSNMTLFLYTDNNVYAGSASALNAVYINTMGKELMASIDFGCDEVWTEIAENCKEDVDLCKNISSLRAKDPRLESVAYIMRDMDEYVIKIDKENKKLRTYDKNGIDKIKLSEQDEQTVRAVADLYNIDEIRKEKGVDSYDIIFGIYRFPGTEYCDKHIILDHGTGFSNNGEKLFRVVINDGFGLTYIDDPMGLHNNRYCY